MIHFIERKPRHAALDVHEFFRAQVRAEASLRNAIIRQLQRQPSSSYRVAAVSNICKKDLRVLMQVCFLMFVLN